MKLKFYFLPIMLLPALVFSQPVTKIKMYGDGNTSVKINDSATPLSSNETKTWLDNSALVFSENGQDLYFRHPTGNYYQVWSVATREKLSEITFAEAGNTPKGREIIAAFPNIVYNADANANSKIWLSADLYVTFDNRNNFNISGGQNQIERSFTLKLRKSIDDNYSTYYRDFFKKADVENTRYQLYYHKKSNKLYIIAYADQVYKKKKDVFSNPYNGIFCFDVVNNTLNVLAENPDCAGGNEGFFRDQWFFYNDNLFRKYLEKENSLFGRYNLSTLSQQDIKYATYNREHYVNKIPDGWRNPFAGTDLQENLYIVNPINQHLDVFYFNKSNMYVGVFATILHSSNKKNEVQYETNESPLQKEYKHTEIKNVMAISLSGKYFAYLSLNNRAAVGNYASIMMYNADEKDRVYTFNDQTKYQPYITKGYVTNKESEDLDLAWQKQAETNAIAKKKKDEANALAKKKQDEAEKLERQKRYKPQLDALVAKITESEKEMAALRKADLDYYNLKDFKSVLIRNKWSGQKVFKPSETSPYSHNFYAYEELEFRNSNNGVTAVIKEQLKFPVSKKTDKNLLLTGDPGFYENYVEGVKKGEQYISSNCEAVLVDWNLEVFRTNTDAYPFCQVKGLEVLNEGNIFKEFGDRYLNFLMKAKFTLSNSKNDNRFYLKAVAAQGQELVLESKMSVQEMTLSGQIHDLRKEIEKMETMIETGK